MVKITFPSPQTQLESPTVNAEITYFSHTEISIHGNGAVHTPKRTVATARITVQNKN